MNGNTYIQNIETVNGSASQQNSGVISIHNTTSEICSDICCWSGHRSRSEYIPATG